MNCFVKSFQSWRTLKQAVALTSDVILDSLDKVASSVTIAGTDISFRNVGNWMILDSNVYLIDHVKPKDSSTVLSLLSPLEAFSRRLPFDEQPMEQTVGSFIADTLRNNWVNGVDPVYAAPYLTVSNSDTTPFVAPDLDSAGLFSLVDYCRKVRRTYGIRTDFYMLAGTLACQICKPPEKKRQVSFTDGRSQLKSTDYGTTGIAKITTVQDGITLDWYLSEDGVFSSEIPNRRAIGSWTTISVAANVDIAAKVAETFAKNRSGHKVEFYSELDLDVLNRCIFVINGEHLESYISTKRRLSTDTRTLYTAGELATTASDKLKGAIK